MVRGFTDDKGRFRPTDRKLGHTRANPKLHDKSLQVGIQGSQIAQTITKQAKDFAKRKTEEQLERIFVTKERQERELQIRRDFEKRLISSFKRARKLQIKDPVLLKNQILIDVPEIKDNPENIRFIENILNGFIKREKAKDKAIKKAKTQVDKELIEAQFEKAEQLEETDVKKLLGKQEKELKKKQQEKLEELERKDKLKMDAEFEAEKGIQEFVKEDLEAQEAEEKADKERLESQEKADELTKKAQEVKDEQELKTTEEFIDFVEAQSDALEAIEVEEKEKDEAEEAREVAETLAGDIEDVDVGFPKEIIA